MHKRYTYIVNGKCLATPLVGGICLVVAVIVDFFFGTN